MVAVVQTAGDLLAWHPHVHAIASRGGWDRQGHWTPVPFVDAVGAERLFQHRVIALLSAEGLLSQERIVLLLSWRHSGFSAHDAVTVPATRQRRVHRGVNSSRQRSAAQVRVLEESLSLFSKSIDNELETMLDVNSTI